MQIVCCCQGADEEADAEELKYTGRFFLLVGLYRFWLNPAPRLPLKWQAQLDTAREIQSESVLAQIRLMLRVGERIRLLSSLQYGMG
jgi:hypothetical protein